MFDATSARFCCVTLSFEVPSPDMRFDLRRGSLAAGGAGGSRDFDLRFRSICACAGRAACGSSSITGAGCLASVVAFFVFFVKVKSPSD